MRIAIVGKYVDLIDSYKSLHEALVHGGIANECRVQLDYVDSERIETEPAALSEAASRPTASSCRAASASAASKGKIAAVQQAREQRHPVLRHLPRPAGRGDRVRPRTSPASTSANSQEFEPDGKELVIALMEQQKAVTEKGGTMRLGAYPCKLADGTLARRLYGKPEISERHRHRFEVNNELPRGARRGRPRLLRHLARRAARGDDRARRTTRGSSAASSTPSSRASRSRRIRSSSASSARRSSVAGSARRGRDGAVDDLFAGAAPDAHRRALRHRVVRDVPRARARAARAAPRRAASASSSRPPSTRPTAPRSPRTAARGSTAGLEILRRVKAGGRACRCSPTSTMPEQARAGRRGRRRPADPGLPLPADRPRSSPRPRPASRSTSRRGSSWPPSRHAARGRASTARPAAARCSVTERGSSFGYHNLVVDMRSLVAHARAPAPRWSSTPPTRCSARAPATASPSAIASSPRCWRAPRRRSASTASSARCTPIPNKALSDAAELAHPRHARSHARRGRRRSTPCARRFIA